MVRRIKSLKGKSLKRTSFVTINDEITLPITTRSISEVSKIKYETTIELPTKLRPANMEEIEGVLKNHPRYSKKAIPMVQEFDVTSKEFISEKEKETILTNVIDTIKYIDMDYMVDFDEDEQGNPIQHSLWEDLEITKGNWVGVAEYFVDPINGLGMTEKEMEQLYISIKELQGESLFEKLKKFEKISGNRNMFDILTLIDRLEDSELEEQSNEVNEDIV